MSHITTAAEVPKLPRPRRNRGQGWDMRLCAATLCVFAGGVTILLVPGISPSVKIFANIPVIIMLAALGPMLILAGWTILRQGYSLRSMMIGVIASAMLLTYSQNVVQTTAAQAGFIGPMLDFVPSDLERRRIEDALQPAMLSKVFNPVFAEDGIASGVGITRVKFYWMNTVREEDVGEAVIHLSFEYNVSRHPNAEQPLSLLRAYADLKARCFTIDHCTYSYLHHYAEIHGKAFDTSFSARSGMSHDYTHEGALEAFAEDLRDAWGDPVPFLQAIAERDPDVELRKAAPQVIETCIAQAKARAKLQAMAVPVPAPTSGPTPAPTPAPTPIRRTPPEPPQSNPTNE